MSEKITTMTILEMWGLKRHRQEVSHYRPEVFKVWHPPDKIKIPQHPSGSAAYCGLRFFFFLAHIFVDILVNWHHWDRVKHSWWRSRGDAVKLSRSSVGPSFLNIAAIESLTNEPTAVLAMRTINSNTIMNVGKKKYSCAKPCICWNFEFVYVAV